MLFCYRELQLKLQMRNRLITVINIKIVVVVIAKFVCKISKSMLHFYFSLSWKVNVLRCYIGVDFIVFSK